AHAGRDAAPDPTFPGGRRRPARQETPAQANARMKVAADRAREKAAQDAAEAAATHTPDATPAAGSTTTEGATRMNERAKQIRAALGLGPDATTEEVNAALAAAETETVNPPTPPAAEPANGGASTGGNGNTLASLAALAKATGAVLIDASQLDEMRKMAALGQQAHDTLRIRERDEVIDQAIHDGKIALSRKRHFQTYWDADPEGCRAALNALERNTIPVDSPGYAGSSHARSEADVAYNGLYGEAN
ncbi:MAG TPA: phage protease, partial [Pilimelia sp.]|nr:phage protease [Pilimelia sp.]